MSQPLIIPQRAQSTKTTKVRRSTTTIGFVNLGCSKNQVDSEIMLGSLMTEGFQLTSDPQQAEVVIVNTCGFIEEAKEESINTILEHGHLKKSGTCRVLIAAGCLAQRYQGDLLKELPELDAVVGTGEFGKIAEICRDLLAPKKRHRRLWISQPPYLYDELAPRLRLGKHHSAYVKIAEGCNRNCTFCAIPLMRGGHVSRPMEELVLEAKSLAKQGTKELLLIAQDSTYYGLDIYKKRNLAELLQRLSDVNGIEWIRLHYAFPAGFPMDILDVMAERSNICNYLDIPLQHASSRMLQSMRRGITRDKTEELLERIRTKVPGIAIRTTMIAGHPGESEQDFQELLDFVERSRFDRLGVFTYSHEDNTHSFTMKDDVPDEVKQERMEAVMELQQSISLDLNKQKIGQTFKVMVDRKEGGNFIGRTESDSPEVDNEVIIETSDYLRIGDFVNVTIQSASEFDLTGAAMKDTHIKS